MYSESQGSLSYAGRVSTTTTLPYAERTNHWHAEPQMREVLALALVGAALFAVTILHFRDYRATVENFGDSGAYVSVANAIRHWDFKAIHEKQFWGYSYAVAALSTVTRIPVSDSLLLVSILSSLTSTWIVLRLWDGWAAALFAILNFDWLQRSYLGGSEPLFALFLFASFWAARRERWILASCLAACATVTRPVGIFALAAIGLFLITKKRYREVLSCAAAAVALGILYILPFWIYFGDPLYQVHRYQTADWRSGPAITWPFYAIAQSVIHNQQPWTNMLLTLAWIGLVAAGVAAVYKNRADLARRAPVELYFVFGYGAFLFCYNSPQWARSEFPRFAIPILPLVYVALKKWVGRDRRIIWALGVIFPVVAACSALGIRNVVAALHGH